MLADSNSLLGLSQAYNSLTGQTTVSLCYSETNTDDYFVLEYYDGQKFVPYDGLNGVVYKNYAPVELQSGSLQPTIFDDIIREVYIGVTKYLPSQGSLYLPDFVTSFSNLTDVSLTNLANNQTVVWDGTENKWVNSTISINYINDAIYIDVDKDILAIVTSGQTDLNILGLDSAIIDGLYLGSGNTVDYVSSGTPAGIMIAGFGNDLYNGDASTQIGYSNTATTAGSIADIRTKNKINVAKTIPSEWGVQIGINNEINSSFYQIVQIGFLNRDTWGSEVVNIGLGNTSIETRTAVISGDSNDSRYNNGLAMFGYDNTAYGNYFSSIIGNGNIAKGNTSGVEMDDYGSFDEIVLVGNFNKIDYSSNMNYYVYEAVAVGSENTIGADDVFVGTDNENFTASSDGMNVVIGNNNSIYGNTNIVLGNGLTVNGENLFIVGHQSAVASIYLGPIISCDIENTLVINSQLIESCPLIVRVYNEQISNAIEIRNEFGALIGGFNRLGQSINSRSTTHNSLANIYGGTTNQYYHLTYSEHNELTLGAITNLHNHNVVYDVDGNPIYFKRISLNDYNNLTSPDPYTLYLVET